MALPNQRRSVSALVDSEELLPTLVYLIYRLSWSLYRNASLALETVLTLGPGCDASCASE